jgi:hypothetical protein
MSYRAIMDNSYKEGTIVRSKEHPEDKLKIMRYYQRIYYCSNFDLPSPKHFAYFERELSPPVVLDQIDSL